MNTTIKCVSCNGDVTKAKIDASFSEFAGKPIVELELICPHCGEEYITIAAVDFIGDNSEKLIINKGQKTT